ncbi:MAG: prephenate dehydratase [Chloroflexi bacterium]|nr:prephenate dehydratase [Chloroflexota bacterium]
MTKRLAYLGPAGTYSEQAALDYEPTANLLPFASIPAVAAAVDSGLADECIVPIENSLEGSVTFTLDLLIHDSKLFIRNELVIPIEHCLIVKSGTKFEDIKTVFSHPQSLGQCRSFLEKRFPAASQVASLSNSAAVEEMLKSEVTAAAIASQRAASLYDAEILAQGIADNSNNHTRFVILAPSDHAPTGMDKTSLCFSFDEDAPGIVHSVLADIARRNINLTKIESRPTKQTLGRYIFLLDIEGHRLDANVSEALDAVKAQVSMLKVFGSYPMQVSSSV